MVSQGVPIRMEVGPRDFAAGTVVLARRDTGVKDTVAWADLTNAVPALLEQIQVHNADQSFGPLCNIFTSFVLHAVIMYGTYTSNPSLRKLWLHLAIMIILRL